MNQLNFTHWIWTSLGIAPASQFNIALSLVIILSLWLSRRLLLRAVERRIEDAQVRYRWRKTTTYLAFLIGFVVSIRIWVHGFSSLTTMVGLISAGIAIALRDPLVNLAGWLFIISRQPFSVGDRIQVGESVAGDVIDQRVFSFTLMEIGNWVQDDQSTGRIIHVPNGRVFTETIANYSKGFRYIWDELSVLVTFESDWRGAKAMLKEIVDHHATHLSEHAEKRLREASRTFMIFYSKLTPIVYTTVEGSGVKLTLRYLTEPQMRRARKQALWEDILDEMAKRDDIDFAYPTQRMYFNIREGKTGARPQPAMSAPPDPGDGYFD